MFSYNANCIALKSNLTLRKTVMSFHQLSLGGSDARPTGGLDWWSGGRRFDPRLVWQHSFVEIDHEIFSADSRRAVVSLWQKNVHKYWLTA